MFAIDTTTRVSGPRPEDGEQTLADAGANKAVLDPSRRWQRAMEAIISRELEELTERTAIASKVDSHIDPDLAVEVSVLEPAAKGAGR